MAQSSQSTITAQRGAIRIELDRPRVIFYDLTATFALIQKYGIGFVSVLYSIDKKTFGLELKDIEALA
jgi:hypothetical protein